MGKSYKTTDNKELLKRALLKIDELEARQGKNGKSVKEPVAIIGLGCRFAGGANDPASFWRVLRDGVDTITEFPDDRWDTDAYYDPDPEVTGKMYTRSGALLDQVDKFDPQFFGISPREAVSMDPQHRLLLEVTWEALENAGQAPSALAGSNTGVFVGIGGTDYSHLMTRSGDLRIFDTYLSTGINHSIASGRIPYLLGLQGICLSVDTACSSSLTAMHLAVRSLRSSECDMALVGGVNVIIAPDSVITICKGRMLAPDGHCKTFDAAADGYVRGEGCGILVLKRLSDAVANCDNILAVIRGSAVNQDGRTNGLTAPNGLAQEMVIRAALDDAAVEPSQVSYLEAHGTGTELGDPIEVRSLASVFGSDRTKAEPLRVGSVKTNIGHLEAGAGVAGLIKLVLALKHKQIPPHLNLNNPNPHIPWDEIPITVPTKLLEWQPIQGRRIGGVSSFGYSGTNVHAILEEAPLLVDDAPKKEDRPAHILALSARSVPALKALTSSYLDFLENENGCELADICFTANAGRSHFNHRLAIIGKSNAEVTKKLTRILAEEGPENWPLELDADEPGVVFMFTGQGAQYPGIARNLYETQPTFRKTLDRCSEILEPFLEQSLISVIYPESASSEHLIHETGYTQPALFAVEYALAMLWKSWGVEPALVIGHSVGEYVAACVAGVFGLEDGLRLIATRARLMQSLPKNGTMAAVLAERETVEKAVQPVSDRVSIAAFNGPKNLVISGEKEAVAALLDNFAGAGLKSQELTVSHAFHSPLMEPILDEFQKVASEVKFSRPQIGVLSNLTGNIETGDLLCDPVYWRRHVREAVNFNDAMQTIHRDGSRLYLEAGPNAVLLGMAQRCLPDNDSVWLPSLRKGKDDWQQILSSLGQLYSSGLNVDWNGFDGDYRRRRVELPTYPFQRKRYWHVLADLGAREPAMRGQQAFGRQSGHPLLGSQIASPLKTLQYQTLLSSERLPYLSDHRFFGKAVFPATGYLEMAVAAATRAGRASVSLRDVKILEALLLQEGEDRTIYVTLTPEKNGDASFQVYSQVEATSGHDPEWKRHAEGKVDTFKTSDDEATQAEPLKAIKTRCRQKLEVQAYYNDFRELGVSYGPSFQGIVGLWRCDGEALGQIRLAESLTGNLPAYHGHPTLVDSGLQLLGAAFVDPEQASDEECVYMPTDFRQLILHKTLPAEVWAHAQVKTLENKGSEVLICNLSYYDKQGEVLLEIQDLHLKRVRPENLRHYLDADWRQWLYNIEWEHAELAPAREPRQDKDDAIWLVFADRGGTGASLTKKMTKQGLNCCLLFQDDAFSKRESGNWQIRPGNAEDLARVLSETLSEKKMCGGIVYAWGLDTDVRGGEDVEPMTQLSSSCEGLLPLLHGTSGDERFAEARLCLLTRGAVAVTAEDAPIQMQQTSLWGLAKVINLEMPGLRSVCLDLDPNLPPEGEELAESIVNELRGDSRESQVAFRAGGRRVARLVRGHTHSGVASSAASPLAKPQRLEITARGVLDNLKLVSMQRRDPGAGEVEIEVHAAGLNFRDVLNVLGMYPGDAGALGSECAGKVVSVGANVPHVSVGDEVVAMASGGLASYVTVSATFVARKPARLTLAECATIPITFLTAQYGLHHLAGMRKGERVLIHAGAGGVGMAAIQLAQRAGAEIYATAGSPAKRDFLKSLGVKHVADSRSLSFAEDIMEWTQGEGVDIVLNSLAGDFIPKSLSLLRAGGRFIEIGKIDVWNQARATEVNPDVASYHAFYLGECIENNPEDLQGMFRDLLNHFESEDLQPLPLKTFKLTESVSAFRFMAQAKHIGKVVIVVDTILPAVSNGVPETRRKLGGIPVTADGSYLITGGLGALGLQIARQMAASGAGRLVLMGRHAPSEVALQSITEISEQGAEVLVVNGDIARKEDVKKVLAEAGDQSAPLRGIVHAAGVLADGILSKQNWPQFQKVLAPKAVGAWYLHQLTKDCELDFFVLFSSAASMFGSPGQANYATANAYLDGLAAHRQALGLPALSINWGPWAEGGMAAELGRKTEKRRETYAIGAIPPEAGSQAFIGLLASEQAQAALIPIDWNVFAQQFDDADAPPFFDRMLQGSDAGTATAEPAVESVRSRLEDAMGEERLQIVLEFVRDQIINVLDLDASQDLSFKQGLMELGLDSLMAVELSNRLQRGFECSLPSTLAFEYPSIEALSGYIIQELFPGNEESMTKAGKKQNAEIQEKVQKEVDVLSEDEVEETLLKELERGGF